MDSAVGDVIAFEVYGTKWSWRLGVVQSIPAPRLREIVIYRKKWSQMPKTARGAATSSASSAPSSGNVVSDEDEDEAEGELDATYVENGKGKLRTILTSSIIFNLGDEEDVVGDDGKSIKLDHHQQVDVGNAIKNFVAGAMPSISLSIAKSSGAEEEKERDNLGATIIPKFKLNLPQTDTTNDDPGYIALPLPTGRAQNIYDNAALDDGVAPAEKIATLKAALFEYEGQIKSLIEQVEHLRGIAGSKSANVMVLPNPIIKGLGAPMTPKPGSSIPSNMILNTGPAASPRKVRIATVADTHADPTSDMAILNATMATNSNDVESLRAQIKSVTKQLSDNRIKYDREIEALKVKNAELTSIFDGWRAVAGTLNGGGAVSPSAFADLKNARDTLHTARQTYRKTARKSTTSDGSGEEQLNAAEAFLDLQTQLVSFITQAEGQRTARNAAANSRAKQLEAASALAYSPLKPAPKVPGNRPPPLASGSPSKSASPMRPSGNSGLLLGSSVNSASGSALSPPKLSKRAMAAASTRNSTGPPSPALGNSGSSASGSPLHITSPPLQAASPPPRAGRRISMSTAAPLVVMVEPTAAASPATPTAASPPAATSLGITGSPIKKSVTVVAETPLSAATESSAVFASTTASSAAGDALGKTTSSSKPKAKAKPKPKAGAAASAAAAAATTAAAGAASPSGAAAADAFDASPSHGNFANTMMEGSFLGTTSAGCGMSINMGSSPAGGAGGLLGEFARACGMLQANQLESDAEVATLRKENQENARRIAEMMTQLENMRKMRDKELETLRNQIERLNAAEARSRNSAMLGTSPLDARALVTEDISHMPSASPMKKAAGDEDGSPSKISEPATSPMR